MTHDGDQQPGAAHRADKLRNLSQRLDAAAGEGEDEEGGHIRSHPDTQVTPPACALSIVSKTPPNEYVWPARHSTCCV